MLKGLKIEADRLPSSFPQSLCRDCFDLLAAASRTLHLAILQTRSDVRYHKVGVPEDSTCHCYGGLDLVAVLLRQATRNQDGWMVGAGSMCDEMGD